MFAQLLSELELFGLRLNSRRHRLHDRFVLLASDGAIALVAGAL
jgi:hypothetical protein